MKLVSHSLKFIIFLIILSACTRPNKKAIIQNRATGLMNEHWIGDLEYLEKELPARHKNLFFQLDEKEFQRDIRRLKKDIPNLPDHAIIVRLMQVIAKVGDSHTGVALWRIPFFRKIPVEYVWFNDGIFAVAASGEYREIIGRKIVSINNTDISKVIRKLGTIVSYENDAQVKEQIPLLIAYAEILNALGIIRDKDFIPVKFEDMGMVNIGIVENESGISGLKTAFREGWQPPLYLKNKDIYYWYAWLEENQTIYFQYNRCSETDSLPFKTFMEGMLAFIDEHEVNKFIFDMRLNGGGNSSIAEPLINALKENGMINQAGRLYVCVGRKTYSSAILNSIMLRKETNAIFVGEPTGGKPNHYGEVKALILPNSGITISYSTKFFQEIEKDEPSFYPDIEIELSSGDFFEGRDPVLDTILGAGQTGNMIVKE